MTDPTTRAQWRAEAERNLRELNADDYRPTLHKFAPRVIALCGELTEMEKLAYCPDEDGELTAQSWRDECKLWEEAADRLFTRAQKAESALAEYERDLGKRDEWEPSYQATIRKLSDALAEAQAEIVRLEKLAYLPNEHGGPSIETYQAEVASFREDAALLDGLGAIIPTMFTALPWGAFKGAIMEDSTFMRCMDRWEAQAQAKGEKP